MFAQNNIERRRPLYPGPPSASHSRVFFSDSLYSFSPFYSLSFLPFFFLPWIRERFLRDAAAEKGGSRARVRVHYLYFFVLCASLNTTCSIRKQRSPVSLRSRARIFIFHFNFHFSRSTHVRKKGRTLGHSYGIHTASARTGRREFTSAARPPRIALARRNYLVVITTGHTV